MPKESLVDTQKRIARLAAAQVIEQRKRIRDALRVRPWEAAELSPEASLEAFAEIVDDPLAWGQLVQAERQLFHLTEDVAPKELVIEARRLYARLQERG